MSGAFIKFPRQLTEAEQARFTEAMGKHRVIESPSLLVNHFRAACVCGHVLGNFRRSGDGVARCQARLLEHLQDQVARFFGPTRVGDA